MKYLDYLNIMRRIWDFIKRHILDAVLIMLIITVIVFYFTGIKPLYIMSESMLPVLKKDTIVIGKVVDSDDDICVGDIYTYKNPDNDYTVTHRIIADNGDGTFVFKGDNNSKEDRIFVKDEWIKYKIIWYPKLAW